MKKGFTLIEILAVVTIIGLIFILVIPKITTSLKNKKKDVDTTTNNLIVTAAKSYVNDNHDKFDKIDNNTYCLPLTTLTKKDYLDSPVKNVTDDLDITNSKSVKITYNKGFKYEVVDKKECEVVYNIKEPYEYLDNYSNVYERVDYLKGSGTQWIDTGVKLTEKSKIELEIKIDSPGSFSIFGSRTSATENNFAIFLANNDYYLDFYNYQKNRLFVTLPHDRKKIVMSNKILSINDEQYNIEQYDSFETPENAYLFYMSGNPPSNQNSIASMQIYRLKIYNDDIIVKDFIPVKDQNNIGCLFDKVSKTCFYSEGDNDFTYSPVSHSVIDNNFSKISFIETNGTQYIDTGIKANGNLHTRYKLKFLSDYIHNSLQINGDLHNNLDFATGLYQNKWFFRYGNVSRITGVNVDNKIHVFDLSADGGYVDDIKIAEFSNQTFQSASNIFIGARNSSQIEGWCYERIYSAKIYNNDTLVRDYIPVVDSSDRPCLYDNVEKKCYYNQGTGEFLYG